MSFRAHRSAYALVLRPLGEAYRRKPSAATWNAFKDAAFTWYEDSLNEGRGVGAINRELRLRFDLNWSLGDSLKAHYSLKRLSKILYDDSPSPFLALLERAS